MPSFVRVTNLENGRRVILRINDRGPYVRGRIIDVSQKAAELLGFADKGTTKIRVQILGKESKAIADASRKGKDISSVKFPKDIRDVEDIESLPEAVQVAKVPVAPSNIYVQAGSFTVRKNAEKLKVSLSEVGNIKIEEVIVNGLQFHRVQVGPVPTIFEADVLLEKLANKGIKNPRITVK
jgi:rare lipoprotein A